MENRLNQLERKEIAAALQQICVVSDIDAPEDLGAVIDYMQRKFKVTLVEITEAMDFWIINESKIIKPRRLNVKFLSDVLAFYRSYQRAVTKEKHKRQTYQPTPEEIEESHLKGYKHAFEDYYYTIKTGTPKLMLKLLEINCDYAVRKGWVKNNYTDEQIEAERDWLRGYARRYFEDLHKNEDNIFKRIQHKFVDRTDYEKCIVMSLHFRDRIALGHVPEQYQNNPII